MYALLDYESENGVSCSTPLSIAFYSKPPIPDDKKRKKIFEQFKNKSNSKLKPIREEYAKDYTAFQKLALKYYVGRDLDTALHLLYLHFDSPSKSSREKIVKDCRERHFSPDFKILDDKFLEYLRFAELTGMLSSDIGLTQTLENHFSQAVAHRIVEIDQFADLSLEHMFWRKNFVDLCVLFVEKKVDVRCKPHLLVRIACFSRNAYFLTVCLQFFQKSLTKLDIEKILDATMARIDDLVEKVRPDQLSKLFIGVIGRFAKQRSIDNADIDAGELIDEFFSADKIACEFSTQEDQFMTLKAVDERGVDLGKYATFKVRQFIAMKNSLNDGLMRRFGHIGYGFDQLKRLAYSNSDPAEIIRNLVSEKESRAALLKSKKIDSKIRESDEKNSMLEQNYLASLSVQELVARINGSEWKARKKKKAIKSKAPTDYSKSSRKIRNQAVTNSSIIKDAKPRLLDDAKPPEDVDAMEPSQDECLRRCILYSIDDLRSVTEMAENLKLPIDYGEIKKLVAELKVIQTQNSSIDDANIIAILRIAEARAEEFRKCIAQEKMSEKVILNFEKKLFSALKAEGVEFGKSWGGEINLKAGNAKMHLPFAMANFHQRYLPDYRCALLLGKLKVLRFSEALAFHVTRRSKNSDAAFCISVHLWNRRGNRNCPPIDSRNGLRMNSSDWYDTRQTLCVLHVK